MNINDFEQIFSDEIESFATANLSTQMKATKSKKGLYEYLGDRAYVVGAKVGARYYIEDGGIEYELSDAVVDLFSNLIKG